MVFRFILSKILQCCYTHAKTHIAHLCWGGDDAVPDIGRPGRESPVLFHAARLLARQDIQVVAVMAEHLPPVE